MVKMKGSLNKKVAALFLAVTMLMATSTTAFAFTGNVEEENSTQVEVEVEDGKEDGKEDLAIDEPVINREDAFSVSGNVQVQDDITNGASKEFLTIQTKNNQTFYVVIDRASNVDNVYMLSQIDENDLKEFLGEEENTSTIIDTTPEVVIEETPATPEVTEPKEPENAQTNTGALLGILAVAVVGVGIYGYMKFIKPKKEDEDAEDEGMEIAEEYDQPEEDAEDSESEE